MQICFSESFESLAEGLEACFWQIGGVPQLHRTDNLSPAVHVLDRGGRKQFTDHYLSLMGHYGLQPTTNTPGEAHENGDVEQSHYRFKQAVDQALRVRGSRDFADRASYAQFLHDLVRQRNRTRAVRWATEQMTLRPLPTTPLAPCRELRVTVTRFSTIQVLRNTCSVPSRLIVTTLTVRVRAEILELSVGTTVTLTLLRLQGRRQQRIDYHHIIWALVRKPGTFAAYRYRDELFPSMPCRNRMLCRNHAFRSCAWRSLDTRPGLGNTMCLIVSFRASASLCRCHAAATTLTACCMEAVSHPRPDQRAPALDP